MRRTGIICLTALLAALAGCAKSEHALAPDLPVTFQVAAYQARTKAEISLRGETEQFTSRGFLHAQGVDLGADGADKGTWQHFFQPTAGNYAETVSWDNAAQVWAPGHTYYWPKGEMSYVNFVSWFDALGSPDTGTLSETFLQWKDRTIAAGDNLMVADEAWRYNANAATYRKDGTYEGVPTLFHHLLTQARFQARLSKESDGSTSWSVTLKNFSLEGCCSTGTLTLSNADPGTTGTRAWTGPLGDAPAWEASGDKTAVSGTGAATLGTTAVTVLDERSFLPQPLGTLAVRFQYTIRTTYDASNYIEETVSAGPLYLSEVSGSITEWGMNQRLTYTIVIDPEARLIRIDPTATPWADEPAQSINIE